MIHKLLNSIHQVLIPSEVNAALFNLGYKEVIEASQQSTFQLYKGILDGKLYFIKLASTSSLEAINLRMQFDILRDLYPMLNAQWITSGEINGLVTPELTPVKSSSFLKIKSVACTIDINQQKLRTLVPAHLSLHELVKHAFLALDFFESNKLLDSQTSALARDSISIFTCSYFSNLQYVNHGDLSNNNIFQFNGDYIILDWEDTFYGFPQYDLIYWLTFLSNMKEISKKNLIHLDLPKDTIRAAFILIVTLKEFHLKNKGNSLNYFTTQRRLIKILELLK